MEPNSQAVYPGQKCHPRIGVQLVHCPRMQCLWEGCYNLHCRYIPTYLGVFGWAQRFQASWLSPRAAGGQSSYINPRGIVIIACLCPGTLSQLCSGRDPQSLLFPTRPLESPIPASTKLAKWNSCLTLVVSGKQGRAGGRGG